MRLVIEIPKDLYEAKIRGIASNRQEEKILKCVKNGTPLEKELKKIKAEIEEIYMTNKYFGAEEFNTVRKIIDSHISELKGEQK